MAEVLAHFDTAKVEELEIFDIDYTHLPPDNSPNDLCQALTSMKNLRTLSLFKCDGSRSFVVALDPGPNSANPITCPKLEKLVFRTSFSCEPDTGGMVRVAAARAARGTPFKSIRFISVASIVSSRGIIELRKHVPHVETYFEMRGDKVYRYGDAEFYTFRPTGKAKEEGGSIIAWPVSPPDELGLWSTAVGLLNVLRRTPGSNNSSKS